MKMIVYELIFSQILIELLQQVTRPKGGINEWLHWLPVSVHKKLYYLIRRICGYSKLLSKSQENKLMSLPSENGGSVGLSAVLEADVKSIVNLAQETYEKYILFLFF